MIEPTATSESNYRRFLKRGQQSAENLYKTYTTIMKSPLLQVGRDTVAHHLPMVARCFLILEGPSTFLQIAPLAGAAYDSIKLWSYLRAPKAKAANLRQLACKILYTSGSLINNTVKVSLAAETFQWTATLATRGFKLTSMVLKTTATYSSFLGVAVWTFSLPKIFVDYTKIEQSRANYTTFESIASWDEAKSLFSSPLRLHKAYRIRPDKLESLKGESTLEKLNTLKSSLRGRAQSQITCRRLKLLVDLTGLVASAIIFTSFLNPVGFALLGTQTLLSITLNTTQKVAKYQFEHRLGLYTLPDASAGRWAQMKHLAVWAYRS